jgi:TRAP-type C4-dicarboxylate transport system permease small subunit
MAKQLEYDDSVPDEVFTFAQICRDWELSLGSLALLGFIVLMSAQVISRYLFDAPIAWIPEVAAILLFWMTFITAAWLVRKDQHIRVEFLGEWSSPRLCAILYSLYDLISIAFLIMLAIGGYQLVETMNFSRTPALRIHYSNIDSIIPVCAVLMAIYFVVVLVRRIHSVTVRSGRAERKNAT